MNIGPGPSAHRSRPLRPHSPREGCSAGASVSLSNVQPRLGISAPSTTRAPGKLNAVATISISGGDSSSSVEFLVFLGRRVRNAEA